MTVNETEKRPTMREALEFYANEKNYNQDCAPFTVHNEQGQEYDELDGGDIARAALKVIERTPKAPQDPST